MAMIARIIGVSLLVAGLGAGLAYVLFGPNREWTGGALLLGCMGGIIGAVAGAAQEIVAAQRQKPGW